MVNENAFSNDRARMDIYSSNEPIRERYKSRQQWNTPAMQKMCNSVPEKSLKARVAEKYFEVISRSRVALKYAAKIGPSSLQ
jgi:hypothetical protein